MLNKFITVIGSFFKSSADTRILSIAAEVSDYIEPTLDAKLTAAGVDPAKVTEIVSDVSDLVHAAIAKHA